MTVHLNVSELLLHVITPAMSLVTRRVYSDPLLECTESLFDSHVVEQFLWTHSQTNVTDWSM